MSITITPTVGRVVWFYPTSNTAHADFSPPVAGEPLAAIIAAVLPGHPVDIVNLAVFDAMGFAHARTMVPLLQDGDELPEGGFYATWMPYQIGQAKKAEDREHDAKQMAIAASPNASNPGIRAHALEMALRTPGAQHHTEVLAAAKAYQAHIEGAQAAPAPQASPDVKQMVDRFLGWRLPDTFHPDAGISFKAPQHPFGWPTGTNLFNAEEARAMFEHVLRDAT